MTTNQTIDGVLDASAENVFACWSCKKPVTMRERGNADGNCPHCDAELDIEDWPFPSGVPATEPQRIEYSSLDPAERLAVCRGEQPVAVVMPERLQQVLKFLDGAENLDGHWFGEPHPSGRPYWWRNELRKAIAETNLFAKQL